MILIKLCIILILSIVISSCVFMDKFYDYNHGIIKTTEGKLSVILEKKYEEVKVNHHIDIFKSPYTLSIGYFTFDTSKKKFLNGEIKNLKMISLKTGNVVLKEKILLNNKYSFYKTHSQKRVINFNVKKTLDIPYEDYIVSFNFKIYKDYGLIFDEGKIELTLKRDYYEGYFPKGWTFL